MQRMINITDISIAVDISKAMKLDYILWKVNEYGEIVSILGSPNGKLSYIAMYEKQSSISDNIILILISKDILPRFEEMLKLQLKEVYYNDDIIIPIGFEEYATGVNKYASITDNMVYTDIIYKMLSNETFVKYYPIYEKDYGYISENEAMLYNMANKTSDGVTKLLIDQYMMFIHKGFIPINKADKVYLKICTDDNNPGTFLSIYSIVKKKGIKIYFCFYCINLI